MARKFYCEVVEGIVYDDRCLFKLSKMVEGNKTCESCILREFEKKRGSKAKRGTGVKCKINIDGRKEKDLKDIREFYDSEMLVKFLGKAKRTIQHWAKQGKIPAQRIGQIWRFPKDEIDCWIKEKTKGVENER